MIFLHSGEILSDANKHTVLFAEAATCQLEFRYLAKLTGNKEYYEKVSFIFFFLTESPRPY